MEEGDSFHSEEEKEEKHRSMIMSVERGDVPFVNVSDVDDCKILKKQLPITLVKNNARSEHNR